MHIFYNMHLLYAGMGTEKIITSLFFVFFCRKICRRRGRIRGVHLRKLRTDAPILWRRSRTICQRFFLLCEDETICRVGARGQTRKRYFEGRDNSSLESQTAGKENILMTCLIDETVVSDCPSHCTPHSPADAHNQSASKVFWIKKKLPLKIPVGSDEDSLSERLNTMRPRHARTRQSLPLSW